MATPQYESELIFPAEHWHNHSSCLVESPNGDLLVCWYHGSGERRADDVEVLGARRRADGGRWSAPFPMANTPGFPDTNCFMTVDAAGRLWLFWGTQLDNQWESTLLKYRIARDFGRGSRPPRWEKEGLIHLKPDDEAFVAETRAKLPIALRYALENAPAQKRPELEAYLAEQLKKADNKLARRIGWMGRCHPLVQGRRMLLPLYSDGFDFSLIALTEDMGESWSCSLPLIGPGAVQPSLALRRDGTLVAFCRNNGPEPQRILVSESKDQGKSWSVARPIELLNPGASVEVLPLRDGRWLLCYNDTEEGRHQIAVSLSEDEGKTWRWTRHLDPDEPADKSYPSLLQTRDGFLHATYSYSRRGDNLPKDRDGLPARESIRHARFNAEWVMSRE